MSLLWYDIVYKYIVGVVLFTNCRVFGLKQIVGMFIAVPSFVCQFSELHTCALFFDVVYA